MREHIVTLSHPLSSTNITQEASQLSIRTIYNRLRENFTPVHSVHNCRVGNGSESLIVLCCFRKRRIINPTQFIEIHISRSVLQDLPNKRIGFSFLFHRTRKFITETLSTLPAFL